MQTLAYDGTKLKPILKATYTRKKNKYGESKDWVTTWKENGQVKRSFICDHGLSHLLSYKKDATKLRVQITLTQPKRLRNVFILGILRPHLNGSVFMGETRFCYTLINLETVCITPQGEFIADEINLCQMMQRRISDLVGGCGTIFVEFEEV